MRGYEQEQGILFEQTIHEVLVKSGLKVLNEYNIKSNFGAIFYGIDHFIETDEFTICIQDKCKKNNIQMNEMNHFIKACEKIHDKFNKKCFAIYMSKSSLTKNSVEIINYEKNTSTRNIQYIYFDNNSLNYLIHQLSYFLYSLHIYFYENDGSVIMLS